MIGAFCTTLCFALTAIFAHRTAKMLGSTTANFWRLLLATLLLGLWAHLAGSGLHGVSRGWFFVSGLAGFGLGGLSMFQALPRLGSNLTMLLVQCGTVVVAAVVEWLWLGTRLTLLQIGFAGLTMTGVVIGLRPRNLPPFTGNALRIGLVWAALSALGQGAGAVLSRKAFFLAKAAHEFPDPATTAYQRAIGGLLVATLAMAVTTTFFNRQRAAVSVKAVWPWVLANVLTGPVLGVTCYQWALSVAPSGVVQPIVATSPLVTIPFAAWLEGSRPRRGYYVGAMLAVAGVAGLYLAR